MEAVSSPDMAEGSPSFGSCRDNPEQEIDLGSRALLEELREAGQAVFMVDGDDLRALTANADYSRAGREAGIRRAQDIALYLSRQGQVVIVSVVAPFRELREEFKARANVKEIFVHTTEVRGREHFTPRLRRTRIGLPRRGHHRSADLRGGRCSPRVCRPLNFTEEE